MPPKETYELIEDAKELVEIAENLSSFAGDTYAHLQLHQRTLALAIAHIGYLTNALHTLDLKFEHARLYGFTISAEDE